MNLSSPPPDCNQYLKKIYDFLSNPVWDSIRLGPRDNAPVSDGPGQMYYNTDNGLTVTSPGTGGYPSSSSGGFTMNPSLTYSWTTGSFSTKNAWADLDISGAVPSSAKLVLFQLGTQSFDSCCYLYMQFKPYGETTNETLRVMLPQHVDMIDADDYSGEWEENIFFLPLSEEDPTKIEYYRYYYKHSDYPYFERDYNNIRLRALGWWS